MVSSALPGPRGPSKGVRTLLRRGFPKHRWVGEAPPSPKLRAARFRRAYAVARAAALVQVGDNVLPAGNGVPTGWSARRRQTETRTRAATEYSRSGPKRGVTVPRHAKAMADPWDGLRLVSGMGVLLGRDPGPNSSQRGLN